MRVPVRCYDGFKEHFSPGWCGSVGWTIILYTKKFVGSIPSQGTYRVGGLTPAGAWIRTQPFDVLSHIDVFLSLPLPLLLSIKATKKMSLGED